MPTDSQIDYGPTTAYGSSSALDSGLVTSHVVVLSGLAPGTLYHYMVRSRDSAGNLAVSGDSTFTTSESTVQSTVTTSALDILDSSPPSVSITAPANAATVSGSVAVSATASDNILVVGVQFQVDGAPFGVEDFLPPYSASWNTTTTEGTHTLTAVARDAAGNRTTSAAVTVTVANATTTDTTPPTVSISAPAGAATVSGAVTVSANASDNVGVAGVRFEVDGAPLGAEDTTAPYSVSWNSATAADGNHTLTAVARDAAGNQTRSATVTVTTSNASAQVALAWDASTDSSLVGYKVYVGDSPGVYSVGTAAGNVTTYTVTGLQRGHRYYFVVTAYDQDGNESGFSNEVDSVP